MRSIGIKLSAVALGITMTLVPGCSTVKPPVMAPGASQNIDRRALQVPIFNEQRLQLTADYSAQHYGERTYRLTDPQMIVVHYTAIPTLGDTLKSFRPAELDRTARLDIAEGGEVNVSTHYVIDRKGNLYQLAAENVICRHVIGYNYTAIGIENVAPDAEHLSDVQAKSTAALISRIIERHPSIRYLIGHHEYRDWYLPHYRLMKELDPAYLFTNKIDPGPAFMARVRELLRDQYGIVLED